MNPKAYCEHETLRDGSPVIVRAVTPEDKAALQDALDRLSGESSYSRFFYPKRKFSTRELEYYTEVDFDRHVALGIGFLQDGETLPIGIGRYIVNQSDPSGAEVAFTVDDNFQGIGVGSLLLKHLVRIARENGIQEFSATLLRSNHKMLQVFAHSQLPMQTSVTSDVIEITLSLTGPQIHES